MNLSFKRRTVLVALASLLAACNSSVSHTELDRETPPRVEKARPEPARPRLAPELAAFLGQAIERGHAFDARLSEARRKRINRALTRDEFMAPFLKQAYEESGQRLLLTGDEGDFSHAEPLVELFEGIHDHAILDPDRFALEETRAALEVARPAAERLRQVVDEMSRAPVFGPLLQGVLDLTPEASEDQLLAVAARAGLDKAERLPEIATFATWLDEGAVRRIAEQEALAELDALLARAYLRYDAEFTILKRAHPFEYMKHPGAAMREQRDALVARLMAARPEPVTALKLLWPANPLYEQTLAGYKRYLALAEADAVKKIPGPVGLKRGARGLAVKKLQARLAAEGYYEQAETYDGVFGPGLETAVKDYQFTHQLDQDGAVGRVTLKSLNKPMAQRAKQIALSLQRWRESHIPNDEPYYFRINIPQFELEVWDHDEVARRHRVVVGNTKIEIERKNMRFGPFNYTRPLDSEIHNVVINPKWRVPPRIRLDELELELINDPAYYENHAYELEVQPDGVERIVQGTGDKNALGRVKFNFKNPYAIYLHDTPMKPFFERTWRAFSHGCMRLHNALDMGLYVLETFQGMKKEEIDKILESLEETPIPLDKHIPIHVEYNSVSVDPKGRMMFLIDIYHFDRAFYDRTLPYRTELYLEPDEWAELMAVRKDKGAISRWHYASMFKKKHRKGKFKKRPR